VQWSHLTSLQLSDQKSVEVSMGKLIGNTVSVGLFLTVIYGLYMGGL
jgi:hypothetical protein